MCRMTTYQLLSTRFCMRGESAQPRSAMVHIGDSGEDGCGLR